MNTINIELLPDKTKKKEWWLYIEHSVRAIYDLCKAPPNELTRTEIWVTAWKGNGLWRIGPCFCLRLA